MLLAVAERRRAIAERLARLIPNRRDPIRVKLLFFDGTGVVLVLKRVEVGAFRWPKPGDAALQLTVAEMAALMNGLDCRRMSVPREVPVPGHAG